MQTMSIPLIERLSNGTVIKTKSPNKKKRNEWTEEAWNQRRWHVNGKIINRIISPVFYYNVMHNDGTCAGYDPSEITIISFAEVDIPLLNAIRRRVQTAMLNENLDITFNDPPVGPIAKFTKKDPGRYLVCRASSVKKRNEALKKMKELGYSCEAGAPCYKIFQKSNQKLWTFKIDLIAQAP